MSDFDPHDTFSTAVNNITNHVSLKLVRQENYLFWCFQFLPVLNSQWLINFVHRCPILLIPLPIYLLPTLITWTGFSLTKPFKAGFLPPFLLLPCQMLGLTTSYAMWQKLQNEYASNSLMSQLKFKLQIIRRGNLIKT